MGEQTSIRELGARLLRRAMRDDVGGLAGELACRSFLELFPFFIFLATFGAALAERLHIQNPAEQLLDLLRESLPQQTAEPVRQQLEAVLGTRQHGVVVLAVIGALWLAAGGGATLLKAMNRIYELEETRPWWERKLVGLWLAFLGGTAVVLALLLLAAGQVLRQAAGGAGAPAWYQPLAGFARWPLLVALLLAEAAVVYRVAPNAKPPWRWITPGAVLFAVGWLTASSLFVAYVTWIGAYAATYGALGGVVVLLLWLQLTAYALLLGAELNALLAEPAQRAAEPERAEREQGGESSRQRMAPVPAPVMAPVTTAAPRASRDRRDQRAPGTGATVSPSRS